MASTVLKNGTVLSFDKATQSIKVLPQASILIVDGRIAAIEQKSDDLAAPADAEVVDVSGKIISPGFVNTHVHVWQSVFRTMGPNINLSQYFGWITPNIQTTAAALKPDDIYISSLEGYLEGLNAGVTSYVEHAHNNWSLGVMQSGYRAAVNSGARVWWCYDVADREGFSRDEQWDAYEALKRESSLVSPGLSLDNLGFSILKGDSTALDLVRDKAAKLQLQALTVHHLGGPWPQGSTSPTGLCIENRVHEAGLPLIISHAPFLTKSDIEALRKHDIFVSITPESECHYGQGQATGHEISDQACLGLDTTWTFSGDMINQARLWLQIVRLRNYTKTLESGLIPNDNPMAVEQAFLLATRQGGRALRREDIGAINVGAKADLVVFDGNSPNMLGWSDPIAAVVLHANAGDIEHVLVDGEWRKKDFKLVNLVKPWDELRSEFLEASKRIQPQYASPPTLEGKLWGIKDFGEVDQVTTKR